MAFKIFLSNISQQFYQSKGGEPGTIQPLKKRPNSFNDTLAKFEEHVKTNLKKLNEDALENYLNINDTLDVIKIKDL